MPALNVSDSILFSTSTSQRANSEEMPVDSYKGAQACALSMATVHGSPMQSEYLYYTSKSCFLRSVDGHRSLSRHHKSKTPGELNRVTVGRCFQDMVDSIARL